MHALYVLLALRGHEHRRIWLTQGPHRTRHHAAQNASSTSSRAAPGRRSPPACICPPRCRRPTLRCSGDQNAASSRRGSSDDDHFAPARRHPDARPEPHQQQDQALLHGRMILSGGTMDHVTEREGIIFWHGWPSQWHPSPFLLGIRYGCCEQYMMAEKARLFGDHDAVEILAAQTRKVQGPRPAGLCPLTRSAGTAPPRDRLSGQPGHSPRTRIPGPCPRHAGQDHRRGQPHRQDMGVGLTPRIRGPPIPLRGAARTGSVRR